MPKDDAIQLRWSWEDLKSSGSRDEDLGTIASSDEEGSRTIGMSCGNTFDCIPSIYEPLQSMAVTQVDLALDWADDHDFVEQGTS